MDNSKKFAVMLDKAISREPDGSRNFDRTKNVQGQLQEIVTKYDSLYSLLVAFNNFCFDETTYLCGYEKRPTNLFSSMEQLWLAYVCKEKYNKVWDDKKKVWREEKG